MLDSQPLRRLAGISQLGLVSLVYPGAMHTRLEHTLGVYHNAVKILSRFVRDPLVSGWLTEQDCDAFLLAALLHDVGHWPFCHPIEDMQLAGLPRHETRVREVISHGDLSTLIDQDWHCDAANVVELLIKQDHDETSPRQRQLATAFLSSCLSSGVDIDKLDYLQRDSLHCGVTYGRNFDAQRLMSSLAADPETGKLTVGEKGRTAAEMMVFARYIMFSEVYWHHAVRAATAMLQRSVFLLHNRMDLVTTLQLDDAAWIDGLRRTGAGSLADPLIEGLFGSRRVLFKRVAEFSMLSGSIVHQQLARRPYWWLVALCETVAQRISKETGLAVAPADVLIDAPPVKLEVDVNMPVQLRSGETVPLGDVSPVAAALAREQFDNYVKRVRIFVRPGLRDDLRAHYVDSNQWESLLQESITQAEQEWA